MAKTEVYSLRLDPELKVALEQEARSLGISVAALLDRTVRRIVEEGNRKRLDDQEEQARINAAVEKVSGSISAGFDFSQNVGAKIRAKLRRRRAS